MSIFRESFPDFIQDELDRRQDGMLARTPAFVQQLNTRSAWVRMTSGVNTANSKGVVSNELATKYVLQGGTLLNNTSLRSGIGGDATSTYDRLSPGGNKNRLGIRPMPGITGVNVQSKGAYGSLQEATVSFVVWDIRQLEELELLYMRPGYTVLLEFGWDYTKPLPRYDILNRSDISLNDAFAEIYELIRKSGGNYDALLGYVKNYNWSARDDGGYDCTTTIISLGEVLESLKCNWIPMETVAFTNTGLLGYGLEAGNEGISASYENGIISGLLHELFYYLDNQKYSKPGEGLSYSRKLYDRRIGKTYDLFMSKRLGKDVDKIDRGGLPKPLGSARVEGYITLASFCDLINGYVLLKDINNKPISQITTNETNSEGNIIDGSLLKCIASPLSLSTNYGVCFVRNDNWKSLGITVVKEETATDENLTGDTIVAAVSPDIKTAIENKSLTALGINRIIPKISQVGDINTYPGNLRSDLEQISREILNNIVDVKVVKGQNVLSVEFKFFNGNTFVSTSDKSSEYINFFDYFDKTRLEQVRVRGGGTKVETNTPEEQLNLFYLDLFGEFQYAGQNIYDNTKKYTPDELRSIIKSIFSKQALSTKLQELVNKQLSIVTSAISEAAANVPGFSSGALKFLVPDSSASTKALGYIGNIYVNLNFLYSQAVSKNVASTDVQNKNTISIREYLQSILREIQNSLGNINNFDIQVDNRNAVGRIIDINYTGDPALDAFVLQVHNLNSVVRNYTFQSKIFPEMGSIIAISAQDATGVGKLGYDNATLVAWNEGIKDRLIPKRDFNRDISLTNTSDPTSFIFPFLSKIYTYFEALDGKGANNKNLSYGGLDFAYRDFLANLNRFDPQNKFAAIIPTELSVTMDGIGGIVIGNIFKINQDIIPKGYKGTINREIAYIVAKLGHNISDNDWTTELSAYPIVLQKPQSTEVWKKWKNNQYPNSTLVLTNADGSPIVQPPALDAYIPKNSNIPVIRYLAGKNYKNGEIPSNELRYLKITTDPESNTIHQLHPAAASQWEKLITAARSAGFSLKDTQISLIPGAAYRPLSQQQVGPGRAPLGTSVHGWGAAVDIQSLIDYQRSFTNIPIGNPPAGAEAAAKVRAGSKLYQWLNTNAARYGWINPPKLKDGSGEDEAWHWEYWGPVSGGAIGASEPQTTAQPTVTVEVVAAAIKDAAEGFGTKEAALVDAINRIPDKAFFLQVNNKVKIQNILNEELGAGDRETVDAIKEKLAKLGITLTYTPTSSQGGGSKGAKNIKIIF